MIDLFCICGKPVQTTPYCSDRCKYILDSMDTPIGSTMTLRRAMRFFGKQWDKKHPEEVL